ncbi:MAG: hypothetical protein ABI321_16630 [Polyangia bacterium]
MTRLFYEGFGKPELDHALPTVVRELAQHPPPVSVSVPEIVVNTLHLALGDALGYSEEQFIERAREVSRSVISGPLYRVLFTFISPERLLKNAASRWEAFHRGTSLSVDLIEDTRCRILMHAPPHASTELLSAMKATGFEVALVAAGAKNLKASVKQVTSEVARFEATWTR